MADWRLEYTIDVDLDTAVIRSKIYGQWTAAIAEAYHRDFKEKAQPLLGKPWAKIVDLTNWKVSRDEATDVIGEHMEWSLQSGCAVQMYVLNNPGTFRQLNEMFKAGDARTISKTFRTMDEAERYLAEQWPPAKRSESPF